MRWTSSAEHPIATGSLKGEAHRCHNLPVKCCSPAPCMSTTMSTQSHGCFKIPGIFTWKSWKSWNIRQAMISCSKCQWVPLATFFEGENRTSNHVAKRHNLSCEVHCWLLPQSWQVWVSKNGRFAARKHPTAIGTNTEKDFPQVLKVSIQISENIKIHQGTWSICIEVLCHCHCHMHIILC